MFPNIGQYCHCNDSSTNIPPSHSKLSTFANIVMRRFRTQSGRLCAPFTFSPARACRSNAAVRKSAGCVPTLCERQSRAQPLSSPQPKAQQVRRARNCKCAVIAPHAFADQPKRAPSDDGDDDHADNLEQ